MTEEELQKIVWKDLCARVGKLEHNGLRNLVFRSVFLKTRIAGKPLLDLVSTAYDRDVFLYNPSASRLRISTPRVEPLSNPLLQGAIRQVIERARPTAALSLNRFLNDMDILKNAVYHHWRSCQLAVAGDFELIEQNLKGAICILQKKWLWEALEELEPYREALEVPPIMIPAVGFVLDKYDAWSRVAVLDGKGNFVVYELQRGLISSIPRPATAEERGSIVGKLEDMITWSFNRKEE